MTVALVDDEYWIRQGLRARITWEALGLTCVGEAANGTEALALLDAQTPDLVLIDVKMPAPDGLEVVRLASVRHPGTTFVVISGFGEFEYAQRALRYGVQDFLLKPVDPVQVNQTLARIKALREAQGGRVAAYVTGRAGDPGRPPGAGPDDQYQVALLRPDRPPANADGRDPEGWLRFRLSEVAGPAPVPLWRDGAGWAAVVRTAPGAEEAVVQGLGALGRDFPGACGPTLSVGLGRPVPWGHVHRSWVQARIALGHRLVRGTGALHRFDGPDTDGLAASLVLFNRHTERKLVRLAEDGEADAFFPLLETVFQGLDDARERLDFRTLEVVLWRLYTVLVECSPEAPGEGGRNPGDFFAVVDGAGSLADLRDWFTAGFRSCWAPSEDRRHRPDAMAAARDYVEHNYFANLTLTDLARRFGLHPNYFSQRFKEAVGTGLVDYVRQLRLARAHDLLRQTRCSVEEAAHGVGYDDPKYFSELFKTHYGVTPTQFRDAPQE